jgi:hypothetical protein
MEDEYLDDSYCDYLSDCDEYELDQLCQDREDDFDDFDDDDEAASE